MKKAIQNIGEKELNFVAIFLLCAAMSLGFFIEFGKGQTPCPLCFLQRVSMMGLAFCLYLNIRFGVQARFYGFALLWALLGMSCALRHVALNVCKPVPADAFLFASYRLYTWAFLTFFFSIIGIAFLLCLPKKDPSSRMRDKKGGLIYTTASLLILMLAIGFCSVLQAQGWEF